MFQFQLRRLLVVSGAQGMSCWLCTLFLRVRGCNRWRSRAQLGEQPFAPEALGSALLKLRGGLRRPSFNEWFVRDP